MTPGASTTSWPSTAPPRGSPANVRWLPTVCANLVSGPGCSVDRLLLQERDKLGERLGRGGELVDLLICDLGEVGAECFSDPFAVGLEREAPALGQVDEDDAPVV